MGLPTAPQAHLRQKATQIPSCGRTWRRMTLEDLQGAGEQETLNWFCLAGAMEELGRKHDYIDFSESYIFNSSQCAAIYNT